MSDIFREVEEDVRRERLEKFWKAYGAWVIALAVLVLVAVGAYQFWQRRQAAQRLHDSDAYAAAQRISDAAQAAPAFAKLADSAKGGYHLLAQLSQANALFASGRMLDAVNLYKQIGDEDSGEVGTVARLRAAWALAATAPRGDLEKLLAPLDTGAWRGLAREVLAFSDYRAAKIKQASSEYHALADDAQSPEGLRGRAQAMAAFLDNGAGGDSGTVPPPPPPPPAAAPAQ